MRISSRFLRRCSITTVAAVALLSADTAAAGSMISWDFEAPAAGSTYLFGDVLSFATATVVMSQFQFSSGVWFPGGVATVDVSNFAAGSPVQELNLNNITFRVFLDDPGTEVRYRYADLGGNVNFGVNFDFRNVADLADLDGTVVGGCDVSVTELPMLGGVFGEVTITPQAGNVIEVFGVGGQEFWVDDVCVDG